MNFAVSINYVDAENRPGSKMFEGVAADFTAASAAAADLVQDFAGLCAARVLSYSVSIRTVYTDVVDTGANRDEGITLVLLKTDNYKGVLKVPAPISGITDGNGNVDVADAAVTAFVSNFLTGAPFRFSDGEQGSELLSGKLDK